MKTKGLLNLFILLSFSLFVGGCNVATQEPKAELKESSDINEDLDINPPTAFKYDQNFYFTSSKITIVESSNSQSFILKRNGSKFPDNQAVIIEIAGDAEVEDFSQITVDGVAVEVDIEEGTRRFRANFPEDDNFRIIKVTLADDAIYEGDELALFKIIPNNNDYSYSGNTELALTLVDDEAYPRVSFSVDSMSQGESSPNFNIAVQVSSLSEQDIIVPIRLNETLSSAGASDSNFSNQSITFTSSDDDLTETISIDLNDDNFNELTENMILEIINPINANIGLNNSLDISIEDNESDVTYSLTSSSNTIGENGQTTTITLSLEGTLEEPVEVPLNVTPFENEITATLGQDFTLSKTSFTLSANTNNPTDTITVTTIDDNLYELSESFSLNVTTPINTSINTRIQINENGESAPQIGFIGSTYQATEGSTFNLPVTLSQVSAYPITVAYSVSTGGNNATPEIDHSLVETGSFVIPAGYSFFQYPIGIFSDTTFDVNEVIEIELDIDSSHPSHPINTNSYSVNTSKSNTSITILEEGALTEITLDSNNYSIDEDISGIINFTMNKKSSNSQAFNISIENISTNSSDLVSLAESNDTKCTLTGPTDGLYTVTILPDQQECPIEVNATNDNLDEPIEQFRVNIRQPQNLTIGAIQSAIISVNDINNPVNINLSIANESLNEGSAQNLTISIDNPDSSDSEDNKSGFNLEVGIEVSSTEATEGIDYSVNSKKISIPANSSEPIEVNLQALADGLYENGNETIYINILSGSNYNIGTISTSSGSSTADTNDIIINEQDSRPVLTIKDSDSPLIVNENDLVNVILELSAPTVEDIYIQLTGADGSATISNDVSELPLILGDDDRKIKIPAGQTQGSLTFRIDYDNLYEPGGNEDFTLTLTDSSVEYINSSGAFTSAEGVYADIPSDITHTIEIVDIDTPSVARFIGDENVVMTEGESSLSIPIALSSRSNAPSTFKVQIIQTSSSDHYKADENDLVESTDTDITIYNLVAGNSSKNTGSRVNSGSNSALEYSSTSNIIYERQLVIPPGKSSGNINIQIIEDTIYEGAEQIIVKLAPDSFSTSLHTVNTNHDTFTIDIQESLPPPSVSLDVNQAVTTSEETNTQSEIENANTQTLLNALSLTSLNFDITITSFHQHEEMTFDAVFTGSAELRQTVNTKYEYMLGDYRISPSLHDNGSATGSLSSNIMSITIPAGDDDIESLTPKAQVQIYNDYKYEEDETITVTLNNNENLEIGATAEVTRTIENDDTAPIVYHSGYLSSLDESGSGFEISIATKDSSEIFLGSQVTSIPFNVEFSISRTERLSGSVDSITLPAIELNSSNNFQFEQDIDPSIIGDFRKYSQFSITLTSPSSHATIDSSGANSTNIVLGEMKIFTSKGSSLISGTTDYTGHTCTLFRGQVMCFGSNAYGQLGRGNTTNFGGTASDIVNIGDNSNVIDFGNNSFGVPHFIKQLALGENHTCALLSTNEVKCWGDNQYGQLGYGSTSSLSAPNSLSVDLGSTAPVTALVAMKNTTCVLLASQSVKCWGKNDMAQAGVGDISDTSIGDNSNEMGSNLKSLIFPNNVSYNMLTAGGDHACMRRVNDNQILCWGNNDHGQLGQNTDYSVVSSSQYYGNDPGHTGIVASLNTSLEISQLSAGDDHTCISYSSASAATFNTRCFGSNESGELGTGRPNKTGRVVSPTQNNLVELESSNRLDRIGSRINPAIYTSLLNSSEALGTNTSGFTQIVQIREPTQQMVSGGTYNCGVYNNYFDASGASQQGKHVKCWGSNSKLITPAVQGSPGTQGLTHEIGVLNNIGSHDSFSTSFEGSPVEPFASASGNSLTIPANFYEQLRVIGDEGYNTEGDTDSSNQWIHKTFNSSTIYSTSSHDSGWVSEFFRSNDLSTSYNLNFELNYVYAMTRQSESYITDDTDGSNIDISLSGGENHVCAVVTDESQNQTTQLNDRYSFTCWGANGSGQTANENTTCKVIGGSNSSCSPTARNLSYTY